MEMAQWPNGSVEVLLSDVECEGGDDGKRVGVGKVKKMRLNHGMLDIAFAGVRTNVTLRRVYGNGWSSQFMWLMTANALTSKSTIYPEWFTNGLAPWVHDIPIQNTYSNLYDALVFFRSDLVGRGAYEELVAKIAREGM
ncbi:hypothetical protein AZE42_12440 [Rhizopogon vesiculosus]|uniref:Glycosyl transferase CAP10 domain-containing protein n=1 Tax=Rhizopogon vesiculosus TaxID=180088 RepID=A0A1J8PSJ8_9AGAM|nr:hypothetical protein AZE42_12440 [Rhizopogon vesiculosus]